MPLFKAAATSHVLLPHQRGDTHDGSAPANALVALPERGSATDPAP
jgi:hypothetical protein